MKIRAVIFDIYDTLLEVFPPRPGAPAAWERLWRQDFRTRPRLSLAQFSAACQRITAREKNRARKRGIPFPEVCWPAVAAEALPGLDRLSPAERDDFLFQQTRQWHTVRLAAGAPVLLRGLRRRGLRLGIASNAQAYTLRELQEALGPHGLGLDLFEPGLCFWSFEHGFCKPDPHVFRILSARLAARNVRPGETLMVGDRLDKDIEPAKAQGWRAWQAGRKAGEGWAGLRHLLGEGRPR